MQLLSIDKTQEKTAKTFMLDNKTANALSRFFCIFSDRTRLKIISLLSIYPMCVGDISSLLKINQTTVSHQLRTLKFEGIVDCEKDGKIVTYRVIDKYVNIVLEQGVDRNNESFA